MIDPDETDDVLGISCEEAAEGMEALGDLIRRSGYGISLSDTASDSPGQETTP